VGSNGAALPLARWLHPQLIDDTHDHSWPLREPGLEAAGAQGEESRESALRARATTKFDVVVGERKDTAMPGPGLGPGPKAGRKTSMLHRKNESEIIAVAQTT
jgi:hypothetical protein